jgi:hypothetical protein
MALEQNGTFQPSERIVSPGVFTREIDQSFLAQGVAAIGGVVVAPFPKGPGFSPTVVTSEADLTSIFGDPDGVLYGPYTAQQYIRQQGQVTICRVGGLTGYEQKQALIISAIPGEYERFTESGSLTGTTAKAVVSGSGSPGTYSGWMLTSSLNVTFTSGEYSGSTQNVGTVQTTINNVTGSAWYTQTGSFTASLSNSLLPHDPADALVFSGSIWQGPVGTCGYTYYLNGKITGKYGSFDVSSWSADTVSEEDGCGTASLAPGRDEVVLAVLANTAYDTGQNLYGFSGSVLAAKDPSVVGTDFRLGLTQSYFDTDLGVYVSSSYGTYEFSIDPEASSYITSVFGKDPYAGFVPVAAGQKIEAAYTYKNFDSRAAEIVSEIVTSGSWKIQITTRNAMDFDDGVTPDVGDSVFALRQAETTWIKSQKVAPFSGSVGDPSPATYDLFKVHTLSDGTNMNTAYKIEVSNVKSAGSIPGSKYGTFTLAVRAFSDTDAKPNYLERFDNLNLDPNSANFVARRIGDVYGYIDYNGKILSFGDYNNVSKYIRIEMATAPYPTDSIPFGFGAYATPIGGDYARLGKIPAMQYCSASIYSAQPGRYASGITFQPAPATADAELKALYPMGTAEGAELDNRQYFAPVPVGADVGLNVEFSLEDNCGLSPLYVSSQEATNVKKRRFVLGFQAGFDGQSPSVPILVGNDIIPTNQQGLNCSTNTTAGSYGYRQALAALSNADEFDFNLITTPGINYQYNPYVVSLTQEVCENRGDAFYIMDIAPNQTAGAAAIQNVVSLAAQFDTNYSATYYPWVKIVDTNSNRVIPVPPSVVMMSVFAANDQVAAEWFAPAGLNRGGIPAAVQVMDRLTHQERDTLYEGKVNPIAAFPGQGIVAWGQKTLQRQPSALDRINVRRLLIALKKFIASSSRYLVFEQNVASTRQRFLNIVNPYLDSVQQRSGLYAFKVVMDDTNNTPDIVDRNILYGQIYLQPTKTAEFIVLDFNVLPTGAAFPGA